MPGARAATGLFLYKTSTRRQHMNTLFESTGEKQKARLEAYFDMTIDHLNRWKSYSNSEMKKVPVRAIGLMIFEAKDNKVLETGLWSTALIDQYNELLESIKWSKIPKAKVRRIEHFFGRNAAGEILLETFKDANPTFDEFCQFIVDYGSYHYTTSEENQSVKQAFKKGAKNWIEAYRMAGIELNEIEINKTGRSISSITKLKSLNDTELAQRFKS